MNSVIKIEHLNSKQSLTDSNEPYYFILLFDGSASFSLDFNDYECIGKNILFLSPFQLLQWNHNNATVLHRLKFHGDYYCIEYHKKEVACNGILFNNIYEQPFFPVSDPFYDEITPIFEKIKKLEDSTISHDLSITKSYLQLILALSSKEKQIDSKHHEIISLNQDAVLNFKSVLDIHFLESKTVSFYADKYHVSVDTFSKKIKKHFGKTPSKLIQERLTLEAKKLLHLTHKSIKEIAVDLGFEDEFYFSRYFKKEIGVSPKTFRAKVGISIVAK